MSLIPSKRIVVTGSCGTVGSELIRQLLCDLQYSPSEVIGLDNNESALFFQDQEFLTDSRAKFYQCDIRDLQDLERHFERVDVVFHTAALKHVVLSERSPEQVIQTNILGVQNVVEAARRTGVRCVLFTSSDKAVNPTNVMGTSKLMGERLMTAANSHKRGEGPIFASTRFGNVLGSSGSVVPIFHNQIAKGGPVTLTDREMTRFVMSIEEAVKLVLDSASLARGGEVFITKMPVVRIEDLAKVMIAELAPLHGHEADQIVIKEIGTKPGEKLYEELMSEEETRRAIELPNYFSVLPAFKGIYEDIKYDYQDASMHHPKTPYVSQSQLSLSVSEIRKFLEKYQILAPPNERSTNRYWPGDKESNSRT